jgi:hypothetical protein
VGADGGHRSIKSNTVVLDVWCTSLACCRVLCRATLFPAAAWLSAHRDAPVIAMGLHYACNCLGLCGGTPSLRGLFPADGATSQRLCIISLQADTSRLGEEVQAASACCVLWFHCAGEMTTGNARRGEVPRPTAPQLCLCVRVSFMAA